MKLIFKVVGIFIACFVIVCLWFLWEVGLLGNWGLESGYYGQFNRVKHVLEEMPNVEITDDWQHNDLTIEDFGFSLVVDEYQNAHITFYEGSPEMKMRDKTHIREFIEQEIKKNSNKTKSYLARISD